MVTTRSAGATEPLESLATPPKRTRKTRKPIFPSPAKEIPRQETETREMREASPEVAVTVTSKTPGDFTTPAWEHTRWACDNEILTPSIVDTPSKLVSVSVPTSTKRSRDETDDEDSASKRARTQTAAAAATTSSTKADMLFMFPKKPGSEDEGDDLTAPPRTYAEQIRRDRRAREIARRNNRLGITPRRTKPVKMIGDNPFGIETFTEQEKAAQAAQQQAREPSAERHHREERSAAPEPETPRRGLFGSLKDLGSGVLGRIASPFSSLTPRPTSPQSASATAPQVRTEPRRRPVRVWDIQYPAIEPLQDETPAPAPAGDAEEEETESEKKRKAFEAKYGRTDRKYDHLHTVPLDGNPDHLLYPPKKRVEVTKPSHESLPPAARAAHEQRKQRRERLHGKPPVKEPPTIAPLFGPNSHYARGTKNPLYEQHFTPGPHPAFRKFAGDKRSYDETLSEARDPEESAKSRSSQPSVEDEQDSADAAQDEPEPSTPAAKRQKVDRIPHTPRSALKAPGSIGRTGRSARFNDNPIMSIKRMSPIYGSSPAGEYPYNPNNLFHTLSDDRLHAEKQNENSDDSTILSDPSPRTHYNTKLNERPFHPGDRLTEAINAVGPVKPVQYVWRDPNDPDWRPSLANPRPGCFRVPDDEDDEEAEEGTPPPEAEVDTPPPPSTPRMSHAELPKPPSTPQSAGALEAANLERRRAEAAKTRPRTSSRLAEVTSARSRSPSPPGLDTDDAEVSDSSVKTPSPILDSTTPTPTWTWSSETNEYISSNGACPDFAYNPHNELVPSFSLRTPSGSYDDTAVGPDDMTEFQRQKHYLNKYNDDWAAEAFPFDEPQTYEEAGVGSKYIHDLIRKNDTRHPEVVAQCDERFAGEWDAHQAAIDAAVKEGKRLVATYPDRDGVEMLDLEEEEEEEL